MAIKNLLLLLIVSTCFFNPVFSQEFEGAIIYEINYSNLSAELLEILPKDSPKSTFYIKGSRTKMDMQMMGAEMVVISDSETQTSTSYTDVMGRKYKTVSPIQADEGIEVNLIVGETKVIAGYTCKKARLSQSGAPDVEVYYAEELKSTAFLTSQPQFRKLSGLPLEYQLNQNGMSMVFSAIQVDKRPLDDTIFDPPKGEYQKPPKTPKF